MGKLRQEILESPSGAGVETSSPHAWSNSVGKALPQSWTSAKP